MSEGPDQDPIPFCDPLPVIVSTIRLPFGMPTIGSPNLSCSGLDITLGNLTASISAFLPLLNCIIAILAFITGLPGAIVPLPSPSKIAKLVAAVGTSCGVFIPPLLDLSICQFIVDMLALLLNVLECISSLLTISIGMGDEIAALKVSADPALVAQAVCLQAQSDAITAELSAKFNTAQILLQLINLLIVLIPGQQPITLGANNLSPQVLTDTEALIQGLLNILEPICGPPAQQ